MAPSQAYSDLIYLFLDGEATETERSVLFSALKDSPALQEEFASAVQVRGALVSDALKLQAPAYIEGQIIEKAGLLASKLSVGSVASSALTTAPTAATPFLLKAGLLILTGAAAGVATLVGIQNASTPAKFANSANARTAVERIRPDLAAAATQNAPTQNVATPQAPQAMTAVSHVSSESPAHPEPSTRVAGSTHRAVSNPNAPSASSLHERASSMHSTTATTPIEAKNHAFSEAQHSIPASKRHGVERRAATTAQDHQQTTSQHLPKTPAPSSTDPANVQPQNTDRTNSAVPTPVIAESPREIVPARVKTSDFAQTDLRVGDQRSERSPLRPNEFRSQSDNWLSHVSLQISAITTRAEYPYPEEVPGRDNADVRQVAVGIGYDITPEFRAGLSGGRESFAIYRKEGDEFKPSHSIGWLAASARYIFNDMPVLRSFNTGLYLQGSIGEATLGPMFKFEPGLEYDASPNVKLGVSASYIGMFFQNGSLVYGTGKTDLNASVTWHF